MPALSWLATAKPSSTVAPNSRSERDDEIARALQAAQPHLARLIQRLLAWPDPHAVEDAVQEALLRAWSRRSQFRGDAAFRTWLQRIAVHTARNHKRRWLRRRRHLGDSIALPDTIDDDAPSARSVAEREQLLAIREAVFALPQRHREVLVLHYLEELSIDEVRTILGLRRNATDARLSRARKAMAQHLNGCGWEERP